MGRINQFLELFGSSKSRRNTEVGRAVITEGSIVGMFNNSHNLNNIVTEVFDSGKHVLSKVIKRMHFLFDSTHSDVTLVDLHSYIRPMWFLMLPLEVVELDVDSVERFILILTCEVDPGRYAICIAAVFQMDFYL
jgi:hypothetical protein